MDVTPRWTEDQPYDASLDMHVVRPGDTIVVDVEIANRGTFAPEHAATLYGALVDVDVARLDSVTVAPLGVGERATYRLRFALPPGPRYVRFTGTSEVLPPSGFVLVHEGYVDEDDENDAAPGINVHVDAPLLELRLTGLADTLRAQVADAATLHVTNHSQTRAFAGGLEVAFCALYAGEDYCQSGALESVSPVTIGPIAADAARTFPVSIRLEKDALWHFDVPSTVEVAPCVAAPAGGRDCLLPADFDPEAGYATVALPNLIVDCDAPQLAHLSFLDVTDAHCEHEAGVDRTYAVAWFEAAAGECWRAEFTTASSGTIGMRDADLLGLAVYEAGPACWRIARTGEQLVIVTPASAGSGPNGTLRLERVL